jgi:hypothetical protein
MSFDRVQFRQPTSGDETEPQTEEMLTAQPMPERTKMPAQKGKDMTISRGMTIGVILFVLIAGVASGFAVNSFSGSSAGLASPVAEQNKTAEEVQDAVKVGAVFGVPDEKTFRDEVDGVLIKGGIGGEGSHTLLREGGVSQNVYLTSSVVDLDQFENMKVKVWGETFKGQKAGWLMDVGRLEVSQLDATKPSWYKEKSE